MTPEGQQPKGKLVGFKPLQERYCYYSLDDGTVLGVKPVMVKVFRMLGPDGRPGNGPDGAPAYFYQTQNVTQVLTPEEYKVMSNRELQEQPNKARARLLPLPAGGPRYLPAEDTDLLREALVGFSGDSCLEIGFGSGAVLASASGRFQLAVGTDVLALEEARLATSARVQLVLADAATCFRDGVFDVVFFNPPYLRSERIEDEAVDGGPTGVEVPISFLEEGLRVLKEGGVILALLSTEGDVESFLARCSGLGLQVEQIGEKRLFYETLSIFGIRKGDGSSRQS